MLEHKIKVYIDARAAHDLAKAHAAELRKVYEKAERELVELFVENRTKTHKLETGLSFTARKSCNVAITLGNTSAWLDWLESRGQFTSDYTRQEIQRRKLMDYLKPVLESEGLLALPPDLKVDETPKISVRGWKSYMKERGVEVSEDDE